MSNDLPETGTIESLKIMVNTIKQYCLPEYPENDRRQKPFIGVVLDEVVKEIEASICRQETLQETAAADSKYIAAIPALCRGEEVPCALHVSQPIKELRARIAELEQMVRELVEVTGAEYHVVAGDQYHMLCPGSAIKLNTNAAWIVALYGDRSAHKTKERVANIKAARSKAIALLQPEAGNEVGK